MFTYQVFLCCFLTLCEAKFAEFLICGFYGFSCSPTELEEGKITFECPSENNNTLLLINDFGSPPHISTLIIKNCKELTISFECYSRTRNMNLLHIHNIGTLKIQQDPQYPTQLPEVVILENITYVANIPSFTFSQIDKKSHNIECYIPKNDFNRLEVINVGIGTVHPNGFYMPNNFGNVIFRNVTIDRLKSSAIFTKMVSPCILQLDNSSVGVVESGAIQVYGEAILIKNTTFGEISSNGINGSVEQFFFCYSPVNILQSHAISIISRKVLIWKNTFENMRSKALEKISPGPLPGTSGQNFTYKFFFNEIKHMENQCIHPDFEAYEQVPTDFFFGSNTMLCSCANSAWLFTNTGQGQRRNSIERFNRLFLIEYSNTCSSSCNLPIVNTIRTIRNEKCMQNITTEWLCENPE